MERIGVSTYFFTCVRCFNFQVSLLGKIQDMISVNDLNDFRALRNLLPTIKPPSKMDDRHQTNHGNLRLPGIPPNATCTPPGHIRVPLFLWVNVASKGWYVYRVCHGCQATEAGDASPTEPWNLAMGELFNQEPSEVLKVTIFWIKNKTCCCIIII